VGGWGKLGGVGGRGGVGGALEVWVGGAVGAAGYLRTRGGGLGLGGLGEVGGDAINGVWEPWTGSGCVWVGGWVGAGGSGGGCGELGVLDVGK